MTSLSLFLSLSLVLYISHSLSLLGTLADVLQEANVPIINDAVCNAPDYYDNQITTSMFCAGFEKGGTDACQVTSYSDI
jgi:hypothetical protein